jgi:serine/threonine-protein kinase
MHEPSAMRSERRSGRTVGNVIPPSWQLAPPDPNWNGKRFLSPDGASWFAAYTAAAEEAAVAAHMKTLAFVDGETITYLRGERTWIAVSGFKGNRIFYRKAVIACGGTIWKHIAFEYPIELRHEMDRFVVSAATALDIDQTGCDAAVSSNR